MSPADASLQAPAGEEQRLAGALQALANPTRLRLLSELRTPQILKEIELQADTASKGGRAGRPISRQGVKHHLERLLEIQAVEAQETERSWGTTMEYVVNHQTLYALGHRFHDLARLRPTASLDLDTRTQEVPEGPLGERGPTLVLVHGLELGETFDLDPDRSSGGRWVIGRSRDLEVPLDYDPFVSSRNARVRYEEGRYLIEDLPSSRNGTRVNFRQLEEGEAHELSTGDLIGVGESLLMFRG